MEDHENRRSRLVSLYKKAFESWATIQKATAIFMVLGVLTQ